MGRWDAKSSGRNSGRSSASTTGCCATAKSAHTATVDVVSCLANREVGICAHVRVAQLRSCVCGRVRAEEKREHVLLPGLSVLPAGGTLTLSDGRAADAVHCRKSCNLQETSQGQH
jgi:hypothetical protein